MQLKKSGTVIDNPIELPLVSYFGDTAYGKFAELDYVMTSKILIAECTFFLDEHIERAKVGSHMHAGDMAKLMERSQNKHVILMHITQRTGIGDIRKILRNILPKEVCEKMLVLSENNFFTIAK